MENFVNPFQRHKPETPQVQANSIKLHIVIECSKGAWLLFVLAALNRWFG